MSSLGLTRSSADGATSCQYRTIRSALTPSESSVPKAAARVGSSTPSRSRGASNVTSCVLLACAGIAATRTARTVRESSRRKRDITKRDTLAAAEVAPAPRFTYLQVGMSVRAAAAEVTRQRLIDAAIARFAADGLGTSFDAVAADVGVTKGALYHHFGSKEGLVEA